MEGKGTFTYEASRPVTGLRKTRAAKQDEMDAGTFAVTRLGITPDAKQMEVLRSEAKRGILNCSRQWGKSTVAAMKAVHRAEMRPGVTVLVSSPCERQSALFLRKATEMLVKLEIKPRGDGDNAVSLLLPNGSRIVGLPGNETTTRGFSAVSMLLIDEAARVPDEVYQALRPTIAVGGGDLWLMSTPCGQRGFFYEAWVGCENWFRVSAKVTECDRIEAAFIEEERREKTADCFAQEYLCEFIASEDAVFDRRLVEAAMDDSVEELQIDGRL